MVVHEALAVASVVSVLCMHLFWNQVKERPEERSNEAMYLYLTMKDY